MRRLLLALALVLGLSSYVQAATVTHMIGTADTGATPNTSGAFTPALDDLLVVCTVAAVTVEATATVTSSVGTTFTQILRATYDGSVDSVYCHVADSLVSSATSQTVTFDSPPDTSNGTVIFVEAVAGMSRTGLSAILQSAKLDNGPTATAPTATFAASALTGNPTIGVVGNNTNPATLTPPTSWTEPATTGDLGHATPTSGGEIVFRDSGFTGTTITWGNTSSPHGVVILELDTSAPSAGSTLKTIVIEGED